MDIWSLWWNKTRILSICSRVCTIVWMHHFDSTEMIGEKARWALHKYAECRFDKILKATLPPKKTAAVEPPTSHLANHPSQTSKHAGHCWWSKDELLYDVLQWTPTHGHTSVDRLVKTYICQLWANTRCSLENLPREMAYRDGCRVCVCLCVKEKERERKRKRKRDKREPVLWAWRDDNDDFH